MRRSHAKSKIIVTIKSYQLFGGLFGVFLSLNSQGGCFEIKVSKLFFYSSAKKVAKFCFLLEKMSQKIMKLLEMLDFYDFRLGNFAIF